MRKEKNDPKRNNNKGVIYSLLSGSLSSSLITTLYQPLEVLKTEIQLRHNSRNNAGIDRVFGRTSLSAKKLIHIHGISYLWRGTGASLIRNVPGVGLYYASLNLLQSNFSNNNQAPNDSYQAFFFGLSSRCLVSFLLLPITVVKVRYESGRYNYISLQSAIRDAYFKNGWVGISPTIIRDSLFSGVYYMCYTQLKLKYQETADQKKSDNKHLMIFKSGIISGLIASIVTNPLDVVKTIVQVEDSIISKTSPKLIKKRSLWSTINTIIRDNGFTRFYDGLGPRCLRRTLVSASTWTFYEILMGSVR